MTIDPTVFAFEALKKAEVTFVSYPVKTFADEQTPTWQFLERACGAALDQFINAPVLSAQGATFKLTEILAMKLVDGGCATTALHTVLAFLNHLAEAEKDQDTMTCKGAVS